jgi:hypothetical protein
MFERRKARDVTYGGSVIKLRRMVQRNGGRIAVNRIEFDSTVSELEQTKTIHHLHCATTSTGIAVMIKIRTISNTNIYFFGLLYNYCPSYYLKGNNCPTNGR